MIAVEVENVSKRFRRQSRPSTSLKTTLVDLVRRRKRPVVGATFEALNGITLMVERGKTLGIIGRNGAGKSTLLRLLMGIYRPDSGSIKTHGRVGGVLELGTGFHPEFSGRENVFINGIVLGLSKRDIHARFDEIVRFAELEAFIDEPVKTYSLGMYMRLGFAVAVHADPDVLLIDEVLAVGDEPFQQKCFEKLSEFRRQGKTIIFVSHDLTAVERWSDEVMWLGDGTVRERGEAQRVIELYRRAVAAQEGDAVVAVSHGIEDEARAPADGEAPKRWGTREVEIVSSSMVDASGLERYVYRSGEPASIVLGYKVNRSVDEPVFWIAIHREDGVCCYGTNTLCERVRLPPLGDEGIVEVRVEQLDLLEGTYYLDAGVHGPANYAFDCRHQLHSFEVKSDIGDVGVVRIPTRWTITPRASGRPS